MGGCTATKNNWQKMDGWMDISIITVNFDHIQQTDI